MTKKELVEALNNWPDDAKVEISISRKGIEDKVWMDIFGVENPSTARLNDHCLIYAGRITMN